MYCNKCGKQLEKNSIFCSRCGAHLVESNDNINNNETQNINHSNISYKTNTKISQKSPISKKKKRILIITASVFIAVCIACAILIPIIIENRHQQELENQYQQALEMMNSGEVKLSQEIFVALRSYKESEEMAVNCQNILDYNAALQKKFDGCYIEAKQDFLMLGDYQNSAYLAQECQNIIDHNAIIAMMDEKNYEAALNALLKLGKYKDSLELALECQKWMDYNAAAIMMDNKQYHDAVIAFTALSDFSDAEERANDCQDIIDYALAESAINEGNFFTAYQMFGWLGTYSDAASPVRQCIQEVPEAQELYRNDAYNLKKIEVTIIAPDTDYLLHTYMKIYTQEDDLVSTLFIPSGEQLKIKLPPGTYKIKTGYGWDWFGEKEMFGYDGQYRLLLFNQGNEIWTLQSDYNYTLTLMPSEGGNIGGRDEDLDGF